MLLQKREQTQALALKCSVNGNKNRLIPLLIRCESRRTATDSAVARQGGATAYRVEVEMELGRKALRQRKNALGLLQVRHVEHFSFKADSPQARIALEQVYHLA